jgi:nicotinamidase-related amidase
MTNIPRLTKDNIVFIFIDLQEKLLAGIPHSEEIVSRIELLMEAANLLGLPYVATTQYRKGLGAIPERLARRMSDEALDKLTFSCAADVEIAAKLSSIGRNMVILSGVETHICVLQTGLDLIRKGFHVSVVADAVGARKPVDHELGLKRLEMAGSLPVTAEMLIYELMERSDSSAFKRVLPLIKGI